MTEYSIKYQLRSTLSHKGKIYELEPVIQLLKQIQIQGNLRAATAQCGYSYRKAWNILKQFESLFDQPLVNKQRGKGSHLSDLGHLLLETASTNNLQFKEAFLSAENKINTALRFQFSDSRPLIIIASDSEKLDRLRQQHLPMELHIEGSGQALAAYAEGKCELAGFHIGASGNTQKIIGDYFESERDQFIRLEQRQQGLISHPDNPVNSLQEMIDRQLTFVNRQLGSGTRQLLDRLLNEQNINSESLNGYYHEEHTHLAVASMVSSRQADAGVGIQNVAIRLNLQFVPLKKELYFLVFKILTPKLQLILDKLTDKKPLKTLSYKQFIETLI